MYEFYKKPQIEQNLIQFKAGLIYTIPVYENGVLETHSNYHVSRRRRKQDGGNHKIEPITIANEVHPDFPARFYVIEGFTIDLIPSEEEIVARGGDQDIPYAYANDIDWTYPNIIGENSGSPSLSFDLQERVVITPVLCVAITPRARKNVVRE